MVAVSAHAAAGVTGGGKRGLFGFNLATAMPRCNLCISV